MLQLPTKPEMRFSYPLQNLRLLLICMSALLILSACSGDDRLVLQTSGGDVSFNVDIVDTPETRARGLMFVQSMADDKGMLFDFKEEREVSFWMQNTFIPLDMIFIAADGTVKSIHPNARPHDQTSIPSRFPVRFVLEIVGGRADAIGLKVGDTMVHPLVSAGEN